jgi:hypothetical protein
VEKKYKPSCGRKAQRDAVGDSSGRLNRLKQSINSAEMFNRSGGRIPDRHFGGQLLQSTADWLGPRILLHIRECSNLGSAGH